MRERLGIFGLCLIVFLLFRFPSGHCRLELRSHGLTYKEFGGLTGQVANPREKKHGDARGQEGRFERPARNRTACDDQRERERTEDPGVRASHRFGLNPPVKFSQPLQLDTVCQADTAPRKCAKQLSDERTLTVK